MWPCATARRPPAPYRHGQDFCGFGEPARIAPLLQAEGHSLDRPAFAKELDSIRSNHLSVVENQLLSGVSALAVPCSTASASWCWRLPPSALRSR
jgi:DNA-binding IclR family transcriptional regulator